jgi:hypothetical protein
VEQKPVPKDVSAAIKKRLIRLAETYQRQITPEMVRGYIEGLGDLSDIEVEIAFTAAIRQGGRFMPNPGEIREALQSVKEKQPAQASAHAKCADCGGTGFKTIPHPRAHEDQRWKNATVAVRCEHENQLSIPQVSGD